MYKALCACVCAVYTAFNTLDICKRIHDELKVKCTVTVQHNIACLDKRNVDTVRLKEQLKQAITAHEKLQITNYCFGNCEENLTSARD